jgi:hypothetical protein
VDCAELTFIAHSLTAMINRGITVDEVTEVVIGGEPIMVYDNDKPYHSKLLLKFVNSRPVHVVIAKDLETRRCIVITSYLPNPALWDERFERKIK